MRYTRRYGRAPGGQRVDAAVPLRNGPNVTLVAALSAQGVEAVMELDGALNTASFAVYLEQVLGPGLQPGTWWSWITGRCTRPTAWPSW
ncbi:transposase [Hymenobacter sp. BRD67]|nr:transposase [Hymenobacter sp. BRD67]